MTDNQPSADDGTENEPRFDMNMGTSPRNPTTDTAGMSMPDEAEPYLVETILDSAGPQSDLRTIFGDLATVDTQFGAIDIDPSTSAYGMGFNRGTQKTAFARVFIKPDEVDELTATSRVVGEPFPDKQVVEPFENATTDEGDGRPEETGDPENPFDWSGVHANTGSAEGAMGGEGFCKPDSSLGTIRSESSPLTVLQSESDKDPVAEHLGVDEIHDAGIEGDGVAVGVVDGGITARSRADEINPADRNDPQLSEKFVDNVTDGFHPDWGTTGRAWNYHGNMCATDVLGMAPKAEIYDIRLTGIPSFASSHLAAVNWALEKYREDGKPQVLNISAGLYRNESDELFANNPNHPATRKVLEAIDEGMIVVFAAGNCGAECSHPSCKSGQDEDTGPGRSIWSVNGHPRAITVGAADLEDRRVGYSSQGPSSLDPNGTKPDFCSITEFEGYFRADTGTSAAAPVAAGVIALLVEAAEKQGEKLTQDTVRSLLRRTARDIEDEGPDNNTGDGVLDAKAAYDDLVEGKSTSEPVDEHSTAVPYTGNWDEFKRVSGSLQYAPGAVASDEDEVHLFLVGPEEHLYRKEYEPESEGRLSDAEKIDDSVCTSAPTVVDAGSTRHLLALGPDRRLRSTEVNGTDLGEWRTLSDGPCRYAPAAVARDGEVDAFVVRPEGGTRALCQRRYRDGSWEEEWTKIGGVCASSPTAVSLTDDRLAVFVQGSDGRPYWIRTDEGTDDWGQFELVDTGEIRHGMAAVSRADDAVDLIAARGNGGLQQRTYRQGEWQSWTKVGAENDPGFAIDAPVVVSRRSDSLDAFLLTVDPTEGDDRTDLHSTTWSGSS